VLLITNHLSNVSDVNCMDAPSREIWARQPLLLISHWVEQAHVLIPAAWQPSQQLIHDMTTDYYVFTLYGS
jgi:hypothetical protein